MASTAMNRAAVEARRAIEAGDAPTAIARLEPALKTYDSDVSSDELGRGARVFSAGLADVTAPPPLAASPPPPKTVDRGVHN